MAARPRGRILQRLHGAIDGSLRGHPPVEEGIDGGGPAGRIEQGNAGVPGPELSGPPVRIVAGQPGGSGEAAAGLSVHPPQGHVTAAAVRDEPVDVSTVGPWLRHDQRSRPRPGGQSLTNGLGITGRGEGAAKRVEQVVNAGTIDQTSIDRTIAATAMHRSEGLSRPHNTVNGRIGDLPSWFNLPRFDPGG